MGDIKAFFSGARVKGHAPAQAAPPEGTLAEVEAEGRKLRASEERRAARLAKVPTVQSVGTGPEVVEGPFCRLCYERRRSSLVVVKQDEGGDVLLCRTCIEQIEYDREKRCSSCGTPTATWCPGHTCADCHGKGTVRAENLRKLVNLGWVSNVGDVRP